MQCNAIYSHKPKAHIYMCVYQTKVIFSFWSCVAQSYVGLYIDNIFTCVVTHSELYQHNNSDIIVSDIACENSVGV